MKPEWLHRLIGQESTATPPQLSALLQPVRQGNPCGGDVASCELFLEVKEQLALLSGMDADRLERDCIALLCEEGKDLRPAVYLVYAWVRLHGWQGLSDGLAFLSLLLTNFGHQLHPARLEVKNSTLTWLACTKVLDWLDAQPPLESDQKARLHQHLSALSELCQQLAPPLSPQWGPLFARLATERPDGPTVHTALETPPSAVGRPAGSMLTSTQALMDSLRAMTAYLKQQPHGALAAFRLVRVVRWDSVAAPPPHDGRHLTRLPGPRAELRQQLKRLLLQKQWHGLLEKIEPAFLEAANHFWLDLQFFAWEALGHLGEDYALWREIALSDVALMRNRLAGLEHLCFNDGTPFADDTTLEWLASHAVVRDIEAGEALVALPLATGAANDMLSIQHEALRLAESQGLEPALGWLQSLPQPRGLREQAERMLLMARIAESQGRSDIALGIARGLEHQVSEPLVAQWDPVFTFEVKATYQSLLRSRLGKKDVDKSLLTKQLQRLHQELSHLDPLRAALLPPA